MKTIKDSVAVTLIYSKNEVLDGEWLPYVRVSQKLRVLEQSGNMAYRTLTNRLYNSKQGKRFNVKEVYGFSCINVREPMTRADSALVLSFREA